jgi:predicted molibdopterin-dependent oxidoreductase YjgC
VKLARPKFRGEWLGVAPGAELALLSGLARAALEAGVPVGLPEATAATLPALEAALAAWTVERAAQESGVPADAIRAAARRLRTAQRKAILFGRGVAEHPRAPALLQAIENLAWLTGAITAERSRVMYLGPHHNSQGALDMGLAPDVLPGYVPVTDAEGRRPFEQQWGRRLHAPVGMTAPEILAAAAEGKIRALWIVGDHWLKSVPDRALAERALERAELVIVNELFLTETARRAHVVFAASAFAEREGTSVNAERRIQRAARALSPRRGTRSDLDILIAVGRALGATWGYRGAEDVYREIARLVPGFAGTSWATLLPLGPQWVRATPAAGGALAAAEDPATANGPGDGLWLISGGTLFLQGSLSHRTELLPRLAKPARAFLSHGDAQRLAVEEGESLELEGPAGRIRLPVALDDTVPPGAVFVPYAFPGIELNRLGAPKGAGLRVVARKAARAETVEA